MVVSFSQPIVAKSGAEKVVAVDQIKKRYNTGTEALRGVSLSVYRGDLFGLIGPDGAGKSTVLRILAGVMEPSSGKALILGKAPRVARHLTGYVPQNCALYSELSVEENLRYQAGLYGVSAESFVKLKDKHLKSMGLLKFSDRLAGNLSGGMRQKLALCCALVSSPQLLLLDEPSTGLDPIARRELWQELSGLAQQGVTVVLATPFLDEAERCNRIAFMYEGNIHQSGSPAELQNALNLRRLEIRLVGNPQTAELLNKLQSANFNQIKDIYLYGDHLELLAKDTRAAESELRVLLSGTSLEIQSIYESAANMENVFVMSLRDLGADESVAIPFPHMREHQTAVRASEPREMGIQAEKICKNFKTFNAVDNVQLEIRYGEIFGLLGANGAGKTTTIKMLCGLLKPTSGVIRLAGQSQDLRAKSIRKKIGYMSQKFTLYDGLTVEENLQFYASIYEIPLKLQKRQIDWVIQVCKLGGVLKSVVGRLPLGWKQRIAFGAAVMHEPDILFLDEPTAGVDPLARRQIWNLIRDFALNKAAILVSTHYLDEAEYCNRLAFMAAGKIVTQGSPREIKSQLIGQIIEIKTNSTQKAYSALSNDLGHYNVSIFGDAIHVLVEDLTSGVQHIKSVLLKAQCKIETLRPISSTLEDAFIEIVQRSQRQLT